VSRLPTAQVPDASNNIGGTVFLVASLPIAATATMASERA